MKLGNRVGGLRPWLGVLGVMAVALGLSLQLEGAPTTAVRSAVENASSADVDGAALAASRPVVATRSTTAASFDDNGKLKVGQIPAEGYGVISIVRVDYRDDRGTRERAAGTLFGSLPYRTAGVTAACGGTACSFNIDCDDGDPCTDDDCHYEPVNLGQGLCQGTCQHVAVPVGSAGECDDGLFCNGAEVCKANGQCSIDAENPDPTCCSDVLNLTSCAEQLPRCSDAAENKGAACLLNADCIGGTCERCQPACAGPADCDDGKECNGTEACVAGKCVPGSNPCGAGADCTEGDCIVGQGGSPCNADSDCPANEGSVCHLDEQSRCFTGRCCTGTGDVMDCAENRRLSRLIGGIQPCNSITGSLFFAGDTGRDDATDACGGEDPANQLHEPWGCPKYSRGIMQHDELNPPVYPRIVGPISDSPACVKGSHGPNGIWAGPGGVCTLPVDLTNPNDQLNAVGDDYAFTNIPPADTHLALDAVRFVGGITAGNRISMEFRDSGNRLIEDIVLPPLGAGVGIHVVIFTPSLTIPPSGFMVMRVASDFEPDTEFVWLSTNQSFGVGSNDASKIWVNGTVFTGDVAQGNFLGAGNAVMAFELVGDKDKEPTGACCDKISGECSDNVLSWICQGDGDVFHGVSSRCSGCIGGTAPGTSCRRCSGSGAPCDCDTGCSSPCPSGQSCDPTGPGVACVCASGTDCVCTTGNVGAACTVGTQDADCDITGGHCCNTPLTCTVGFCDGGKVGEPCSNDAECDDLNGTCGAPFCQALVECAVGACCNATDGTCDETSPSACGLCTAGTCVGGSQSGQLCPNGIIDCGFQGFGTSCDADRGFDAGEQHCCRQPTGQRCMGGPNNNLACTTHIQCGQCIRGSNPGITCDDDLDCLDIPDGTCQALLCNGGATPGVACVDDGDCLGSEGVCDGRCVVRGTGADDCEDAIVQIITVPNQGEPAKVITISGNNSTATSTFAHPDTCFDPNEDPQNDPGWWEAFSVDKCARVRIDMCCSDPVHQPQWAFVYNDCAGGCQTLIGNAVDPYVIGQRANARGKEYCPEDNLWQTFGLLPAGTYHHPIFSELAGAIGNYQIHVTVEACPAAACCYLACSGNGLPCGPSSPCPGVETCDSQCDLLNQVDCDAKLGFYSGPPQVATSVIDCGALRCSGGPTPGASCVTSATCGGGTCQSDPDGACSLGSCCTGPGVCEDKRENLGVDMTQAVCEGAGFDGRFIGSVACKGGRCAGVAECSGYSCATAEDCCAGSTCSGTDAQKAQANPCPICEVEGPGNCQAFDGLAQGAPSDLSFGTGHVMADDFVHGGGSVDTVCVWGAYHNLNPSDTTLFDCGENITADHFRVRFYADNNGIPGAMVPGSERLIDMTGLTRPRALVPNSDALPGTNTVRVYGFQLSFANATGTNTPVALTATQTYWIEVANDTPEAAGPILCTWHWMRLADDNATGNNYSAAGDGAAGYFAGSEAEWDQAFCLNTNFASGTALPRDRACCACGGQNAPPDPRCSDVTLKACNGEDSQFVVGQSDCNAFSCPLPPSNDDCADASTVSVGSYSFSSGCATTDGWNPVITDFGTDNIENDLWFHYTVPNNPDISDATERCNLLVSMCGTGAAADNSSPFDSMLAIYKDAGNFGVCPCPVDQTTSGRTFIVAQDENCYKAAVGGPSFVQVRNALPGECYTIRLGGFPGNDQKGTGLVNISCGATFCGDNRRNGTEECDGTDRGICINPDRACLPEGDPNECKCGEPIVCGDGLITGDEECDPNANVIDPPRLATGCYPGSVCDPVACTCPASCGNDHAETGEQCDGADSTECPGQCSAVTCTCPLAECGNGHLDAGEECDPAPVCLDVPDTNCACDIGNCRPLGDILGGCTCACVSSAPPPPNIVWNGDQEATTRSTRSLTLSLVPVVTATAGDGTAALQIKLADLQHPAPHNRPQFVTPNFTAFDTTLNGICSGATTGPNFNGHHCDSATGAADCLGGNTNPAITTDDGTCGSLLACTAAGETGGCKRWVGQVATFREKQDVLSLGTYRAARLQCTPYYRDWTMEGVFTVFGGELLPSSTYEGQTFGSDCKGVESTCTNVSPVVTMLTRRSGDTAPTWNPPGTTDQPDGADVVAVLNKFKGLVGSPSNATVLLQPNSIDPNADVSGSDIVATVDAFKGLAYPFSGPCVCPSTVTCGALACPPGNCGAGVCVKTCQGGTNDGLPCGDNTHDHCPGGTCPATGFCRDRCGRCN